MSQRLVCTKCYRDTNNSVECLSDLSPSTAKSLAEGWLCGLCLDELDEAEGAKLYTLNREGLVQVYLDWRNNFLTVAKFAEHYGLSEEHGRRLVELARDVFNSNHPEA